MSNGNTSICDKILEMSMIIPIWGDVWLRVPANRSKGQICKNNLCFHLRTRVRAQNIVGYSENRKLTVMAKFPVCALFTLSSLTTYFTSDLFLFTRMYSKLLHLGDLRLLIVHLPAPPLSRLPPFSHFWFRPPDFLCLKLLTNSMLYSLGCTGNCCICFSKRGGNW